jgi:hypothetical protein
MTADLVSHKIFAENLLLGESLFLTLKLPPNWELAPGVSRPEIHATHDRRSKKWVASGNAWYVIYDTQQGWAMELAILTRPPRNRVREIESETVSIGGHPASLRWKVTRRGLPWQRHTVTFMIVEFDCLDSERHVKLELSGWCPDKGFQEVLGSLKRLSCH